MSPPRILVAGLPRSGTTWVAEVLGRTAGARYLHEPDNHLVRPDAWWAKRHLGGYPDLRPGAEVGEYRRLWARAFAGGPRPSASYAGARILQRAGFPHLGGRLASAGLAAVRPPDWAAPSRPPGSLGALQFSAPPGSTLVAPGAGPLVVKSVHCARSLEWIADSFSPTVVMVERSPFGVIASWRKLGWDDFLDTDRAALQHSAAVLGVDPPPAGASWLERAAWHYGLLSSHLQQARRRHPGWIVVRHEKLCAGPEPAFRRLCDGLGLRFTADTGRYLAASNRPGDGYCTHRLWHEQVDGGRSRLTPAERALVSATLDAFTGAFSGALPVAEEPSVTTVTDVGSSVSRPLLRS